MLFEKKNHKAYLINKNKISLNRDDDKRFVKVVGIRTLARGYIAQKNPL